MTAHDAIDRSISHNEIVHIDYSEKSTCYLKIMCEDWVDAGKNQFRETLSEYWGEKDGSPWRVHVHGKMEVVV